MKGNYSEEADVCPECGGTRFENDGMRGEKVCSVCGCVIDEGMIDPGPEWRSFGNGREKERTGSPISIMTHDKGLTTEIGSGTRDAHGNTIPSKNLSQIHRMRTWQKRMRISNAMERNLATALAHINRISTSMGLGIGAREASASVYRKAVKKNLVRGRSIEVMVAASIYAACRQCGVPRTLDEVSSASGVEKKALGRTYRMMTRQLRLNLLPTKPQDYVQRFCSELNVSDAVQRKANQILNDVGDKEISSGHGPTGAAAAAIYISCILCHEHRTQKQIADVSGVTEVTIRNRFRELSAGLGIAA